MNEQTVVIKTVELNGKKVAYTNESVFEIQVGRHAKGAYRTRMTSYGNLHQAVTFYRSINIGRGYKKRLVCWTLNKPILARAST